MTILTVDIKGKKSEKALKALQAIADAFDMDYKVKEHKTNKIEDDSVIISADEWAKIQKRLNTEQFYDDFASSMQSIKGSVEGKLKLKNASELFHGH